MCTYFQFFHLFVYTILYEALKNIRLHYRKKWYFFNYFF